MPRLILRELILPVDHAPEALPRAVAQRLGIPVARARLLEIQRRAIDARARRDGPVFTYVVQVELDGDLHGPLARGLPRGVEVASPSPAIRFAPPLGGGRAGARRPVVVGAGPAGLFAALALAEAGRRPILLERGGPVETRRGVVGRFWGRGALDPECNVLFGEGGAGMYSDGKLTSRSKRRAHQRWVLEQLVQAGAPPSIQYDAEAHLGSDGLSRLLPRLRQRILSAGGAVRFHTRFEGLDRDGDRIRAARASYHDPATAPDDGGGRDDGDGIAQRVVIETDTVVVAVGHSARDTIRALARDGVAMEPKPFAIGLRAEMPQAAIDRSQWGRPYPRLGAASFRLTRKPEGGRRACYSFCMCPGGIVVPCAHAPGALTTNGMSLSTRARPVGNAAFLVPVEPADAIAWGPGTDPLWAGFELQERIERAAFEAGGGGFALPAQRLPAFLDNAAQARPEAHAAARVQGEVDALPPSRSWRDCRPAGLGALLPPVVVETLRGALPRMLHALRPVRQQAVLLYGAETRSSCPIRMLRTPELCSASLPGLYPCGEGAGQAGGIVSAAIDGVRVAEAILARPI